MTDCAPSLTRPRFSTAAIWLAEVLDHGQFHDKLTEARAILATVDFDTIVCQGLSGLLFAPSLAREMGKHLAVVRKEGESPLPHSYYACEGSMGDRWIFVDDLICSGATRMRVRQAISDWSRRSYGPAPEFVGTYTYHERGCFESFRSEREAPRPVFENLDID